ncbi:MAG: 4Fe-4S binding protein [Candidatus Diapherotrites archaeon]|nr:4Fe-4S binding protein [Candidatus Diapherotrites archaeon]
MKDKELPYSVKLVPTQPGNGSGQKKDMSPWRMKRPVVDMKKCIGCGRCWVFCPDGAIEWGKDKHPEFRYTSCKGCGVCTTVCPVGAITMVSEDEPKLPKGRKK